MAARTPRRSFAAPFVVTLAAVPACYVQSGPPPQSAPAQPPPMQTAQPQPQQPGPRIANPPPPATNQPAQPPPPSRPVVVANPPRPTQPAQPPAQPPSQNPAQTSPSRWTVYKAKSGDCMAAIKVECQPKATCNPPPPFKVACPEEVSLEKPITVATYDGNRCFVEYAMPACPPKTACNPPRPRPIACPTR